MRGYSSTFLALLVVTALVLPGVAGAEQLPIPKDTVIYPGVTSINYAGQTFEFTTTVTLYARFAATISGEIQITVKTAPSHRHGGAAAPSVAQLRIYWLEGDEVLYEGEPPSEEWTGVVLTEGGFTEK
jgi:hypothetical protein